MGRSPRLKNMKSKYGGFLDATMDRVVDTAVMFGIAFAGAREYGNQEKLDHPAAGLTQTVDQRLAGQPTDSFA